MFSPSFANKPLRVFNDQATAECVGFAADGALLVLLDRVGHKTVWSDLRSLIGCSMRGASLGSGAGDTDVAVWLM
jgi:hypothetical protein